MIEIARYDDQVTGVKTATEMGGNAIMWVYSYLIGRSSFDAGCANAQTEIAQFAERGPVDTVYVTHTHEDHVGGCAALSKFASIIAPSFAVQTLNTPPVHNEFFNYVWGNIPPVKNVEVMPDAFTVGDLTFQVISLPGHCKEGMVGFYEESRRWFFSADGVPLPSKKTIAMDEENVPQVISSMEKIQNLDVEVLFDGHRGPIPDPNDHIQIRIDHLREVQERAKELYSEGKSVEAIVESFGFKVPWYMDQTEGRFGVDYLIKSLLFDEG